MADELPAPAQLSAQLAKCKSVRKAEDYHKSRDKTEQEMKDSKAKLPPLPVTTKQ
jgi:hypothetical protein